MHFCHYAFLPSASPSFNFSRLLDLRDWVPSFLSQGEARRTSMDELGAYATSKSYLRTNLQAQ